jgi:hypothetical protein
MRKPKGNHEETKENHKKIIRKSKGNHDENTKKSKGNHETHQK